MAKNDLLGGSLWEQYSKVVSDRMNNPRYRGELTEDDAKRLGGKLIVADHGAESCGDAVRLYWVVEEKSGKILESRFKSFGCGTAIASSDTMSELCIGKTVDDAVRITNLDVERAMRDDPNVAAVPPQKMHCSVMAYDVIKKAAAIWKGVDIETLDEEDMVCECARVTLRTIKEVIRLNNLKTVEEITQYTKAGAFCKSCIRPGGHEQRKYYLVDILKEVREQMEQEQMTAQAEVKSFADMTVIQKHTAINQVLSAEIMPFLEGDGGSLEVVDLKDNNGRTDLFIHYLGACNGCPSASTGTLYAIQAYLNQKLDPSIRVIPV